MWYSLENIANLWSFIIICYDSSAELQKSMESMYKWYVQARTCYVYLRDTKPWGNMKAAKWFGKGWTLQELVAPENVEFYDMIWKYLGSRDSLIIPSVESLV